jgi:hypothetical protein
MYYISNPSIISKTVIDDVKITKEKLHFEIHKNRKPQLTFDIERA